MFFMQSENRLYLAKLGMRDIAVVKFLGRVVLLFQPFNYFLQHLDVVEKYRKNRLSKERAKETVLLEHLHVAFLACEVL